MCLMKCGLRKVDFEKYIGLDSAFVKCFALIIFYFELWQPHYNYKPLLTVLCIHFFIYVDNCNVYICYTYDISTKVIQV